MMTGWANFSEQDATSAELSMLEVAACVQMPQLCFAAKLPNLKLKIQLKKLCGSLQLGIALPDESELAEGC